MDFAYLYPWIKTFHIIFVIYWVAGLLVLPRFLAYHSECRPGSDEDLKWRQREKSLIRIILNPSMALVWVLGLWLAIGLGVMTAGWMLMKLVLVVSLSAAHGFLLSSCKQWASGRNRRSSRFFRILNEIPALIVVVIVLLVTVKPFS